MSCDKHTKGHLAVVTYLCDSAVATMRAGELDRAEQFLTEAGHEIVRACEDARAAAAAADAAEQHARELRGEAERLERLTRRAGRRLERLAMHGWRKQLDTPRVSDVRELGGVVPALCALALFFLGACSDAGAGDVPAVHFPLATYVDVAGAELGAVQGALATLNAACVPAGSESNTAPTPLFWAHYEAAPADTCTALRVRAGVAGAGAELVDREGCLPELLVHSGATSADVAAELAEFTAGRAELVCSL